MTGNTATVVGTPGYMAPEILLGQKYSNEVDSMPLLSSTLFPTSLSSPSHHLSSRSRGFSPKLFINLNSVWSLGMIMYELMMLQRPYSAASIFQVVSSPPHSPLLPSPPLPSPLSASPTHVLFQAQLVIKGNLPPISESAKLRYTMLLPLWEECVKTEPTARPIPEKIKTVLFRILSTA